jgi:23S rRNA (guanosine2251-2'-O)-methyltransferase
MPTRSFQFRLCLSPECVLRYPITDQNRFGDRCPVCLSQTIVAAERTSQGEQDSGNWPPPRLDGPDALIDNVRSAWNVGAIFRSAEGFGFRHLYLCGITPTPENRDVKKTGLGAQGMVPWSAHKNAVKLVSALRTDGRAVWALERTSDSVLLNSAVSAGKPPRSLVLVVGNEQAGIDPGIIALADRVAHLEMQGQKRSFNVAVAFAVAAHVLATR